MRRALSLIREGVSRAIAHPTRSLLTALTCAVAIAVTVNVISLSYGMDADIRGDVARFGRLTIDVGRPPLIRPGAARAPFGAEDERKVRAAVEGLSAVVVPMRQRLAAARGDVVETRLSLVATTPEYPRTLSLPLLAGRFLVASDRGLTVAVLDASTAKALFPDRTPAQVLGRKVVLEGDLSLEGQRAGEPVVVGVLADPMTYRALFDAFDENRKSRTLAGALLAFRNVYVPEDALPAGELSRVSVALPDDARLERAADRLGAIYPRSSPTDGVADVAVTTFVRRDWMDAIGGTTQTGALFGNIVWMLIVMVACIMLSTLNLITIRERYDELAVRRCEGARKGDIVLQVTAEAVATSLVGGLAGLPIGWAGAALLARIVEFPFRFESRYALPAIGVAIALGLLSSVVPARRAASLDPAAVLSRRLT
jgi:putative ABC transport system permease protein